MLSKLNTTSKIFLKYTVEDDIETPMGNQSNQFGNIALWLLRKTFELFHTVTGDILLTISCRLTYFKRNPLWTLNIPLVFKCFLKSVNHNKNYALKYQGSDKTIVLLGVEFDQESRNLGDFIQAAGWIYVYGVSALA